MLDVRLSAPELVTVDITVEEVFAALKKNGFTHLRSEWWDGNGGCVLGQTAVNLGVAMNEGQWEDNGADTEYTKFSKAYDALFKNLSDEDADKLQDVDTLFERATKNHANAFSKYSLNTQLNRWSVPKKSKWMPLGISESKIGDAIIYWNDKQEYEDPEKTYTLETYEEVAQMAYDLLKPHFAKTVKLLKYEYPEAKKVA